MSAYSVYLLKCRDGSLYTGIAMDVTRRVLEHTTSIKGAKYLRGKGPLTLLYHREVGNRSLASQVESRVKRLPRVQKGDLAGLPARIDAMIAELTDACVD